MLRASGAAFRAFAGACRRCGVLRTSRRRQRRAAAPVPGQHGTPGADRGGGVSSPGGKPGNSPTAYPFGDDGDRDRDRDRERRMGRRRRDRAGRPPEPLPGDDRRSRGSGEPRSGGV